MLTNPLVPNLPDYLTFLTSAVGIPVVNLPPDFTGTASVDGSTTTLTVLTVLTGTLYVGAALYDAAGFIPQGATITGLLTGTGGVGTYTMSSASTGISAGEPVGAYNNTVIATFEVANDTVNCTINASPRLYTLAVYNFATDRLLNFALDIPNQTYFSDFRVKFNINDRSPGTVASASDNGTSSAFLNPEFMRDLTVRDLQMLKTPYGRAYAEFAQDYGSVIWGVS